jgi:hypothetical protein
MNMPVTSPSAAVLASKQLGLLKLNVATPELPSRALVNLTLGTTFSSRPRTKEIVADAMSSSVLVVLVVNLPMLLLVKAGVDEKEAARGSEAQATLKARNFILVVEVCSCV